MPGRMIDGAAHSGGRRPKASKGGNRAWWAGWRDKRYGDLSAAGEPADGVSNRCSERDDAGAIIEWVVGGVERD
jgi:hypothetical protein